VDEPSTAVAVHVVHRKLTSELSVPAQTFYVPLPEDDLSTKIFLKVSAKNGVGPVMSLISFSISTTGTVIWYDHWEDGYETDVTLPKQSTTQIWGDGNASNGCAPTVVDCTDATDVFKAGDSVVLEDEVELKAERNVANMRYDAGDKIQASFPIGMTRGGYPAGYGALMAGAVEVLDTNSWGTSFESPVGTNSVFETGGFKISAVVIMAGENNTKVTVNGSASNIITLDEGQSYHLEVRQGDTVTSDKPVQADLLTGDAAELRWYSLRAVNDWSSKYLSPVGDTKGETKVVLYNPSPSSSISIKVTTRHWTKTYSVAKKGIVTTQIIKTGSGALFEQADGKPFIALSVTDTRGGGAIYDWGFPIVPMSDLTPQVLIGWGFGCTSNTCLYEKFNNKLTRSVVWVTPVEKADIYVDYNNDGIIDDTYPNVDFLKSQIIHDTSDQDMSGAIVFATKPNTGVAGTPVNIAAAWGQDPNKSGGMDESGLDLGTVVLPFEVFQASKIAELVEDNDNSGGITVGDKIRYTILFSNVGQTDVAAGGLTVKDTLDAGVTYVADSMQYSDPTESRLVSISGTPNTPFPLDSNGLGITNQFMIAKRGGTHEISFEVIINTAGSSIINTGSVSWGGGSVPFRLETPIGSLATFAARMGSAARLAGSSVGSDGNDDEADYLCPTDE
jgi:uncharacterized repeat protein (TIGR01451 family)